LHGRGRYWWQVLDAAVASLGATEVARRLGIAASSARDIAAHVRETGDSGLLTSLDDDAPELVPADIQTLAAAGMSIGFHTVDHQVLTALDRDGLGEAITFHQAIGPERKEERLRYLTHYWAKPLRDVPKIRLYTSLDPAMSCGIATVGIEGVHPVALRDYLWNEHRIQTARIFRGELIQGLRISPNVYTTLSELDRFSEHMEHVARNGLPEPYKSMTFERRDFR